MRQICCMLLSGALVLGSAAVPLNGGNRGETEKVQEVFDVLKKFEAGYLARDLSKVDAFCDELFDKEDSIIMGTSGFGVGRGEWFEGHAAVKKIIDHDWRNWDDIKLKVTKSGIRVEGNTAWAVILGTAESRKVKEKEYERVLRSIYRTIEANREDTSEGIDLEVLLWVSHFSSRMLFEFVPHKGDEYIYPLRITAVLVKKKDRWQFRLVSYTFPVYGGIPDFKITREEKEKITGR